MNKKLCQFGLFYKKNQVLMNPWFHILENTAPKCTLEVLRQSALVINCGHSAETMNFHISLTFIQARTPLDN